MNKIKNTLLAALAAGLLASGAISGCNRHADESVPEAQNAAPPGANENPPAPQAEATPPQPQTPPLDLKKPVDFELPDLGGKKIKLSDFRGHPVIVDFWATWCVPCRKQIPELNQIYTDYKSRGLVVLGVSCDALKGEQPEDVPPFVKEFKISYPILIGTEQLVDSLGIDVVPSTFFFTPSGTAHGILTGAGRAGELKQAADALMSFK